MARFIVIHQVAESANLDDVLAIRKNICAAVQQTCEWRNSWFVPETNELLCEWEAATVEIIQQLLTESGATQIFPIKAIREVVPAGPKDYPGEFAA